MSLGNFPTIRTSAAANWLAGDGDWGGWVAGYKIRVRVDLGTGLGQVRMSLSIGLGFRLGYVGSGWSF